MVARSSSSVAAYSGSHLSTAVLSLLSATGFSRSSTSAANLLTEVLQRYMQLVGSACVQHANQAGRSAISPQDLRASLEHVLGGDPVEELLVWAEEEGKLRLGEKGVQPALMSGAHVSIAAKALPNASADPLQDSMRGKDLSRILQAGRPSVTPHPDDFIHYAGVEASLFESLTAESVLRERAQRELIWPQKMKMSNGKTKHSSANGMGSDRDLMGLTDSESEDDDKIFSELDDDEDAASLSSSSSLHRHGTSEPLASPSPRKRRRTFSPSLQRQYGSKMIDYVPTYLPVFPEAHTSESETVEQAISKAKQPKSPAVALKVEGDEQNGLIAPLDVDPEYSLEERRRTLAAQRQAEEAAGNARAGANGLSQDKEIADPVPVVEKTVEERAAEAERAFEALQARRVLRDSFKEAISFDHSTRAATHHKEELEALEDIISKELNGAGLVSVAPMTSSARAFAADYQALMEDPTSAGASGIYLTPPGAAHQDALTKRRRLAHAIADASRYTPNDSLYASVGARPSMLPFTPGPSWVVSTLPPPTLYEDNIEVANALSAPVLTPVRPQGRPAALIPPSGALVPTLGYRHPAHLSVGARVVSSAELLKKVSRYEDPIPLLDDKHAERFFHGLPAARDLLGGSGSSSDLSSNISSTRSSGGGGSGSGNSTLRPALEKLVLQMKEKEAAILPEEDKEELQRRQQELQLQLQAALASESGGKDSTALSSGLIADSYASRIRNGNITLVHTWDWTLRDPFDASLPGKKVRAGDRKGAGPLGLEKRIWNEGTEYAINGNTQH